jgi:hypothetical protein
MIQPTSLAKNSGDPNFVPPPVSDQRGLARVSGPPGPNRRIDRGAVERQVVPSSLPAVVYFSTTFNLRNSLTTGPYTVPLFSLGSRPQTSVMGDWDANGSKTPGIYKGGVFSLYNCNAVCAPTTTFTFGTSTGFPVAGDFNGDGTSDVAVYKAGTWQIRLSTGATSTVTGFGGTGSWPATIPVAGDWDGNGTDGIGFYVQSTGQWTVRQTTTSANVGPFLFKPDAPAADYPVVGDWNGDGRDTVGVRKNGTTTWSLSNTILPTLPVVDPPYVFDFGSADPINDLPQVWALQNTP